MILYAATNHFNKTSKGESNILKTASFENLEQRSMPIEETK